MLQFIIFLICIFMPLTAIYADSVAIIGSNSASDIQSLLQQNGHSVSLISNSTTDYSSYDAVILLRTTGNSQLKQFVLDGGLIITEWDAADWVTSQGLVSATVSDHWYHAQTVVSFTSEGISAGLSTNIGSSYADQERTDFFRNLTNIQSNVDILARNTYNSNATIIGQSAGNGYALIIGYDWADGFGSANSGTRNLIINALGVNGNVPEPTTALLVIAGLGLLAYKNKK